MVIRAKVGGHPPPTLTWYHDGKQVMTDYATELDEHGGLTFLNVETKHAGENTHLYYIYKYIHSQDLWYVKIDQSQN